jgi:hypothetical protein
LGITILIKIRTEPQNECEKETAEPLTPADTPETDYIHSQALTENTLNTENPNPVSAETTDNSREKDAPECAYYFGYVSSGERIPEECLTCSRLLKCLTSKGGIDEEE